MPDDLANHPMIRRLLDQIQQLESRLAFAEARVADIGTPFGRLVMVRRGGGEEVNGSTSGKQWKEFTVVDGTILEFEDGRACDDDESPAALIAPGTIEFVVEFEDKDAVRYVPLGGLFPVSLVKTSGVDGTKTSPATYVYDAFAFATNAKIASDVDLGYLPRPNGKMTPASAGWAAYSGDRLLLYITNERPGTSGC